ATAAAAQGSGFRACRRCRPDAVPGSVEWNVRADVVGRAMRLIGDGVVDREGVAGLAARLGYSARQVQRQLTAEPIWPRATEVVLRLTNSFPPQIGASTLTVIPGCPSPSTSSLSHPVVASR